MATYIAYLRNMKLTAVVTRGEEYFIGQIKELPGVITQGETIEETRANLIDALELYLEDMRGDTVTEGEVVYQQELTVVG